MSLFQALAVFFIGIFSFTTVSAYVNCGAHQTQTQCFGDGAYCCGPLKDECCWEAVTMYSYWWFWFCWFWVFVLIMSCSIWLCVRRRRRLMAQPQYVIVGQPAAYGSIPNGYQQAQAPPSAPSYQEKPPPYSTA